MRPNEADLIQKIKELFELYDDYGSEMPEREINFIQLLLSKAADKGLVTEMLDDEYVARICELHKKYSDIENFDSSEGGRRGLS